VCGGQAGRCGEPALAGGAVEEHVKPAGDAVQGAGVRCAVIRQTTSVLQSNVGTPWKGGDKEVDKIVVYRRIRELRSVDVVWGHRRLGVHSRSMMSL
jgi:hypothetical protein